MDEREIWLEMMRADDAVQLREVETAGSASLYWTRREQQTPIWQVWASGRRAYAGTNMQMAYAVFGKVAGKTCCVYEDEKEDLSHE